MNIFIHLYSNVFISWRLENTNNLRTENTFIISMQNGAFLWILELGWICKMVPKPGECVKHRFPELFYSKVTSTKELIEGIINSEYAK